MDARWYWQANKMLNNLLYKFFIDLFIFIAMFSRFLHNLYFNYSIFGESYSYICDKSVETLIHFSVGVKPATTPSDYNERNQLLDQA